MRIVDPMTGTSYVEKRRVRYNEPGQPREMTFSCYRHYAFLGRDRTRAALRSARRSTHAIRLSALGLRLDAGARSCACLSLRSPAADLSVFASGERARRPHSDPLLEEQRAGVAGPGDGARGAAPAAPLLALGGRLRPE